MSEFEKQDQQTGVERGISSRRAFLWTGGAAAGAVALWGLHRPTLTVDAAGDGSAMVTIVKFDQAGKPAGKENVKRVVKTDSAWKQQLSPIQYDVTRQQGTERAYTGVTWDNHEHGIFRCICCDLGLFSSETKFESGTGWPSFWQPIAKENIVQKSDGQPGDGSNRGGLSPVRCAPWACVRRWAAPDGVTLLHELGGDEVCEGVGSSEVRILIDSEVAVRS